MRKLVVFLVLIVVGLLGYNYFATGEVKLIPSFSLSDEERQIRDLADEMEAARREIATSARAAALAGIDTTSGIRAARRLVARIEKELSALEKKGLSSKGARNRARRLKSALGQFKREIE